MKRLSRLCGAGILGIALLLIGSSPALAWPEWSMNDPYFEIDGRVVHVISYVPSERAGAALHYVLTVNEDSKVIWWLPPGESLNGGSVTIRKSDEGSRDSARLLVRAEGEPVVGHQALGGVGFPMRVSVSGPGLRGLPLDRLGSSTGMRFAIRLVRLADSDDD